MRHDGDDDATWATFASDVAQNNIQCEMLSTLLQATKRKCTKRKRNIVHEEECLEIAKVDMSVDGGWSELENDQLFQAAENDAVARIDARRSQERIASLKMDNVMQKELLHMQQYILEDEAYQLQTTGKSSWTFKKISRYMRDLQVMFEVHYHVVLNPLLVRAFATNVFIDQRAHYIDNFLFKFAK